MCKFDKCLLQGTGFIIFFIIIFSEDTVPPTISNCPSNLFESVQVGTGGAVVNWVEPTATDISATTVTSSHTPGSFFPAGTTTTVTYTFRDSSGNEAVCSFTVTVEQGMFFSLNISN